MISIEEPLRIVDCSCSPELSLAVRCSWSAPCTKGCLVSRRAIEEFREAGKSTAGFGLTLARNDCIAPDCGVTLPDTRGLHRPKSPLALAAYSRLLATVWAHAFWRYRRRKKRLDRSRIALANLGVIGWSPAASRDRRRPPGVRLTTPIPGNARKAIALSINIVKSPVYR